MTMTDAEDKQPAEERLGQRLRRAREAKGVTASKAAAATRIKVQHIEALERDDYRRLDVPVYAKGFIRIYGEYLGLDVEELVAVYAREFAPSSEEGKLPVKVLHGMDRQAPEDDPDWPIAEPKTASTSAFPTQAVRALFNTLSPLMRSARVWAVLGGLVVALALVTMLARACEGPRTAASKAAPASAGSTDEWAQAAPEPYVDDGPEVRGAGP